MAEIKLDKLEDSIKRILISAGLATLTSKKVRLQLEKKFETDFTSRKKEIDEILMTIVKDVNENGDAGESSESSSSEESDSDSIEQDQKPAINKLNTKNPTSRKRLSSKPNTNSKPKKIKKEKDETGDKTKKKTGFGRDMVLSKKLATLLGTGKLSRGDVVKHMYALVKERDLLDPTNKQYVLCDKQLLQIFGVKRFRAFGMMKYLKGHITDPKDLE